MRGFLVMLMIGLGIGTLNVQAQATTDPWQPVIDLIEASELTDLAVGVGTADGIVFAYAKGTAGDALAFLPMPIASSSKWLTAATLLALVEEGVLSLEDHPQAYIDWWTQDPNDPRSQITLAQLLSFTSGFEGEPGCLQQPRADRDACARTIYDSHHRYAPDTVFFYSSTHMHIAGLMAENATGEPFNALFRRLVADPAGMSNQTQFNRPSTTNPYLAGGAVSTGYDYALFLQALLRRDLLPTTQEAMYTDRTPAPIRIGYSPVANAWHYGLGTWRECWDESATWVAACDDLMLVSSGGALGWFPWIDLDNQYFGVIARRGLPLSGALAPSLELAYELRLLIVDILNEQTP